MLLALLWIEPKTEHIPDHILLGKAQRLGGEAYESPALPLSYSASGFSAISCSDELITSPLSRLGLVHVVTHCITVGVEPTVVKESAIAQARVSSVHSTAGSGDVLPNLTSFVRHLPPRTKAPSTITTYAKAIVQLDAFL